MTALSIQPTFPIFTDIDGQPLEDGYVFIGTANLNPITNPITVYWDAALTLAAVQPIRTLGGYPMNSGTPARLYVNSDYSIQVQNKNGSLIYSALAAGDRFSDVVVNGIDSSEVSFIQAGTSAVTRTAQAKMRDTVSVKDFGAVGDGVTDDTVAIQAAINTGRSVYLPTGTYVVLGTLALLRGQGIYGDGASQTGTGTSIKQGLNTNIPLILLNTAECFVRDLALIGNAATPAYTGYGIQVADTDFSGFYNIQNVFIRKFAYGIRIRGSLWTTFSDVDCNDNTYGLAWDHAASKYSTSTSFYNCSFRNSRLAGMAAISMPVRSVTIAFNNCNFEDNCIDNPVSTPQVSFGNMTNVTFSGCYFEDNKATKSDTCFLNGLSEFSFSNCYFNAANRHIYATAIVDAGLISGCRFIGTVATNAVDMGGAANARVYALANTSDKPIVIAGATSTALITAITPLKNNEDPFTPLLGGSVNPGTPTYTFQVGRYSILGNRCFFDLRVSISSTTGMTGGLQVQGLPVPRSTVPGLGTQVIVQFEGITLGAGYTTLLGEIASGSSVMFFYQLGSGLAPLNLPMSQVAAATTMVVSGSYAV